MRSTLAGLAYASADRYLFQSPMGYAPTQQFAAVAPAQQVSYGYAPVEYAAMPYEYAQPALPEYAMVNPAVEYVEAAYVEDNSTSWSWLALAAAAGAAVGTVAQKVYTSSTSRQATADLESGMYN